MTDMIGCDGMGAIGCKWFGCPATCTHFCCRAHAWVCRTRLGATFDNASALEKFACSSCTNTKGLLQSLEEAKKKLSDVEIELQ